MPAYALFLFAVLAGAQTMGPLRVSPSNPRWFVDPAGKAVLLAGSHVWQNLQDNGLIMKGATGNPPPVFDYNGYLDTLAYHRHNFFRLWRWETTKWTDKFTGGEVKYAAASVGKDRAGGGEGWRAEVRSDEVRSCVFRPAAGAGDRGAGPGMFVAVMLFEGWEIQFSDGWMHHPFRAANNVNGMEADRDGNGTALEYNTLDGSEMGKRVLALQEAYVRKVIDT